MSFNLENIRKICIRLEDNINNSPYPYNDDKIYFLSTENVDEMIKATIKLHHTPGINPYSGQKTTKLKFMIIEKPKLYGSYWWTSSTLNVNENSAKIIDGWIEENVIYKSPSVEAEYIKLIIKTQNNIKIKKKKI